jgi:hypothetical protein
MAATHVGDRPKHAEAPIDGKEDGHVAHKLVQVDGLQHVCAGSASKKEARNEATSED